MGTVVQLKNQINNSYFQLKNSVEDKLILVEEKIKSKLVSNVELVQKMTDYHLDTGGKRLRALLTLGSAKMCGYIKGSRDITSLQIVNFGHGPDIMEEVGISESAIKTDYDKISFAKLNAMLGEMKALPIDEYIVIYNPEHKDILIAKAS